MRNNYHIILLILFVFTQCTKKQVSPSGLINWVEDSENGLVKDKTIGDYIFTIQYQPVVYKILKSFRGKTLTKEYIDLEKDKFGDYKYFIFKIKVKDSNLTPLRYKLNHPDDYFGRLGHFSFEMKNDFKLVNNGDTTDCVIHHFERTYDASPENVFVLGFNKSLQDIPSLGYTFIYRDKLFNVGNVSISISGNDINKIPELKI